MSKKSIKISLGKNFLLLQAMVFLFSLTGLLSKIAAGILAEKGLWDLRFGSLVFLVICILAVYAYFWQKILKVIDLSVAYLSKAVGLLWSLIWAYFIFREEITIYNIAGAILIIAGIITINFNSRGDWKDE